MTWRDLAWLAATCSLGFALGKLRFSEDDDVVELLLEKRERQVERDARRHSFSERRRRLADHTGTAAEGTCEGIGILRLHAEDLRARQELFEHGHGPHRLRPAHRDHQDQGNDQQDDAPDEEVQQVGAHAAHRSRHAVAEVHVLGCFDLDGVVRVSPLAEDRLGARSGLERESCAAWWPSPQQTANETET